MNVALGAQPKAQSKSHYFQGHIWREQTLVCSHLWSQFFQRPRHKAVYIRRFGGTRELKTLNHSSLQCADSLGDLWFVIVFNFLCLPRGKWAQPACPFSIHRHRCQEKACRQLACWRPCCRWSECPPLCCTSVCVCVRACVLKRRERKHKILLASCQFQKMGCWETSQIVCIAAFPLLSEGPLCQLKIELGVGEKGRPQVCSGVFV